jgi:hypothetical protein
MDKCQLGNKNPEEIERYFSWSAAQFLEYYWLELRGTWNLIQPLFKSEEMEPRVNKWFGLHISLVNLCTPELRP